MADAPDAINRTVGKGRGFRRVPTRPPGTQDPNALRNPMGATPVCGHTRGQGFRDLIELEDKTRGRGRNQGGQQQPTQADTQQQQQPQDDNQQQPKEGELFEEDDIDPETKQLMAVNERLMADVDYYYNRRVTL